MRGALNVDVEKHIVTILTISLHFLDAGPIHVAMDFCPFEKSRRLLVTHLHKKVFSDKMIVNAVDLATPRFPCGM